MVGDELREYRLAVSHILGESDPVPGFGGVGVRRCNFKHIVPALVSIGIGAYWIDDEDAYVRSFSEALKFALFELNLSHEVFLNLSSLDDSVFPLADFVLEKNNGRKRRGEQSHHDLEVLLVLIIEGSAGVDANYEKAFYLISCRWNDRTYDQCTTRVTIPSPVNAFQCRCWCRKVIEMNNSSFPRFGSPTQKCVENVRVLVDIDSRRGDRVADGYANGTLEDATFQWGDAAR